MAYGNTGMGFVAVLAIMLWSGGADAQSDCTTVLISMSPCVNYITGNSSTPTSQCCTQLATVVRSSPQCLCQVLNGGGSSLGIQVNETQAKALPGACRVQTPPLSSCNAASPAASPTESPTNSETNPSGSETNPSGSETNPSGSGVGKGSTSVPSTEEGGSTSDGSSVMLSTSLLFFLLLVAYGSTVRTY